MERPRKKKAERRKTEEGGEARKKAEKPLKKKAEKPPKKKAEKPLKKKVEKPQKKKAEKPPRKKAEKPPKKKAARPQNVGGESNEVVCVENGEEFTVGSLSPPDECDNQCTCLDDGTWGNCTTNPCEEDLKMSYARGKPHTA